MKLSNLELKWLGNSSILIKTSENIVYIDPYQASGREKADIILITHPHYDHCSIEDIKKIAKKNTIVVMPVDCQSKIARIENINMKIIDAGQTLDLGRIKVGAIPAYNLNKKFHSKDERWVGYILKIKETIIYHAGDTDFTPEMEKLSKYSGQNLIALLPVGGTYTMNAEQAAEAASVIKPGLAIPIHWGSVAGNIHDAENFIKSCGRRGINAKILEKE